MKISLDYLQSNDFDMATNVLGGIDCVKDFFLFSDKCGAREIQKTKEEFSKDLKKLRYRTRVSIWKYIKDPADKGDSDAAGEDAEGPGQETANFENTVSQNPKINMVIAAGLSEQIARSEFLITFKLVNYRMSGNSWTLMGRGLGNAKNLRSFAVNACNLYQDDNLRRLLAGMSSDVQPSLPAAETHDREPFTYNHKPIAVKVNVRETYK